MPRRRVAAKFYWKNGFLEPKKKTKDEKWMSLNYLKIDIKKLFARKVSGNYFLNQKIEGLGGDTWPKRWPCSWVYV